MADFEYRELVRAYQRGDVSLVDQLILSGIRNGFTLYQYREDGIPWLDVARYLHHWSPAILAPDEVEYYKEMLLAEDWGHPDFVRGHRFFVPVPSSESWYPNFPGNFISMGIYFSIFGERPTEGLSSRKIRKKLRHATGPYWHHLSANAWGLPRTDLALRITFWGSDDTGVELDLGPSGSGMDYHFVTPYPNNL